MRVSDTKKLPKIDARFLSAIHSDGAVPVSPYTMYYVTSMQRFYLPFKRFLDIIVSLLALIILSLPMLIVALLVKTTSKGPIFFKQTRIGQNRQLFTILKFRTMYLEAPANISTAELMDADGYITKLGSVLRRTSLDELPQLFNVLAGHMSLIGYRPLIFKESEIDHIRYQTGVYYLKPGISGFAQINGRDLVSVEQKAYFDRMYLERFSLLTDLRILLRTIVYVIRGEGVVY